MTRSDDDVIAVVAVVVVGWLNVRRRLSRRRCAIITSLLFFVCVVPPPPERNGFFFLPFPPLGVASLSRRGAWWTYSAKRDKGRRYFVVGVCVRVSLRSGRRARERMKCGWRGTAANVQNVCLHPLSFTSPGSSRTRLWVRYFFSFLCDQSKGASVEIQEAGGAGRGSRLFFGERIDFLAQPRTPSLPRRATSHNHDRCVSSCRSRPLPSPPASPTFGVF